MGLVGQIMIEVKVVFYRPVHPGQMELQVNRLERMEIREWNRDNAERHQVLRIGLATDE